MRKRDLELLKRKREAVLNIEAARVWDTSERVLDIDDEVGMRRIQNSRTVRGVSLEESWVSWEESIVTIAAAVWFDEWWDELIKDADTIDALQTF